jgi:hypothetical protein
MIDEAVTYLSTRVDWPRDFVTITPSVGVADYDITSSALTKNTIKVLTAYFGDPTKSGDIVNLECLTEQQLKSMYPAWLQTTVQDRGNPRFMIEKTKSTVTVFPTPDTQASASGKQLILCRVYYPPALTSDSDVPDTPIAYQDLIKFYVAYLCYSGKLRDANLAALKLNLFETQIKILLSEVNRELEEQFRWAFTQREGLDDPYPFIIP